MPLISLSRRAASHALAALALAAGLLAGTSARAQAQPAPGSIEQRVAACIACHGRTGASSSGGYVPRLAGKPAGYLYNQLLSFRDGRRFHGDMVYMVRHLGDDYVREMAEYFAALDLPYPPPAADTPLGDDQLARGRQLAREGDAARDIPACVACHGERLMGVAPTVPPLLGLPRLYIASQLGAWLTDDRHALAPDCMRDTGRRLDNADLQAVAGWLAAQPVPADSRPDARLPAPPPLPCSALPGSAR